MLQYIKPPTRRMAAGCRADGMDFAPPHGDRLLYLQETV